MPTNEERREVAAKLRKADLTEGASYMQEIEGFDSVTAVRFVMWPNLVSVLFGDKPIVSLQEIIDRLADLIEPEPKRTCRNLSKDFAVFHCSECGFFQRDAPCLRFCPKCGTKVVGE